jgi:HipA-like C-terminal domain
VIAAFNSVLLGELARRGPSTSPDLQRLTGKSQPTISRAITQLGSRVVTLGHGRRTRYAIPQQINGLAAQQSLWWTNANGLVRRWGTLTFLAGDMVHVDAENIDVLIDKRLPWFLSPLKLQGFLGREWATRLGLDGDPTRWTLEQTLYAALCVDHPTGAISIGEPTGTPMPATPVSPIARAKHYDSLADDVASTLPAGSSAAGEQFKFLSSLASGERVLVKFTPPRGTPFGERWHDLLHAEALALSVLGEHGVQVAVTRVLESEKRTYLESIRFDRFGLHGTGRRHLVSLDAVHDEFTPGSRQNWAATCDALALQKRLTAREADAVRALYDFGHLIGNTDMHFGNLSLWCDDPSSGRFALAPVYDMLPMRWRTDGFNGLQDYSPFEPLRGRSEPGVALVSPRSIAQEFWQRASTHAPLSKAFCEVASTMAQRLRS